jgi:transcriptional regulator with XRE-family HTH domain
MGQLGVYFGQQVRELRAERGWSQAELAEAAGTSEEWVRRIERGAKSPSFDTVEALSSALRVTPARLFAGYNAGEPRWERLAAIASNLGPKELEWLEDAARLASRRPR